MLCGGSRVFGLEIMALTLARGFHARGHQVFTVACTWSDGEFSRRLAAAKIPYELAPFGKISKSLQPLAVRYTVDALRHVPQARRQLRAHLCSFAPDVLIVYNRDAALLARPALPPGRTMFHVHEVPEASRWNARLYRRIGAATATIVAASHHIADQLRGFGIPERKIAVVHNGLDLGRIPERREGRLTGPVRMAIIGQIGAWKGHDDFLAALKLLREEGLAFEAVIIGTGDEAYVTELRARAEAYGLGGVIAWRGYLADQASVYSSLDIVVVPSRFPEPFGLTAAEAGAWGLPVVASRRGGLPEIVSDGESGFLVDAECPEQLADRLGRLIRNPELRARFGAAGRQRAITAFSAERMVAEIEALCVAINAGAQHAAS